MKIRKWLGSKFEVSPCYFDENGCEVSKYNKNEEGVQLFITVPFTGSGEYAGSTVEKANRKVLTEMFEAYEKKYDELKEVGGTSDLYEHPFVYGEDWVEGSCGYGYEVLVIRGDFLVENLPHGIEEAISGLEDHCIICEDTHSEIETDLFNETWDNYGESEINSAAEKTALEIVDCDGIHLENSLFAWLSVRAYDLWRSYCEIKGEYPTSEGAESAHLPLLEECGEILGERFATQIVWC